MEAKTMGNYLIYDLVDKEFGTDINGMAESSIKESFTFFVEIPVSTPSSSIASARIF